MKESDIFDLLYSLGLSGKVVAGGAKIELKCPFARWTHAKGSDSHPSFTITINNEGHSIYGCFACKQRGRLESLPYRLAHARGGTLSPEQEEELRGNIQNAKDKELAVTTVSYSDLQHVSHEQIPCISDSSLMLYDDILDHEEAEDYMLWRNVSAPAIRYMGLLYDPTERRILFPVRGKNGELYGMTGRSILQNPKVKIRNYGSFPKGKCILGIEHVKPELPIVVVEGLFAYARLVSAESYAYCSPVAIMGSSLSKEQRDLIISFNAPVILMLDGDSAGIKGTYGYDESVVYQHESKGKTKNKHIPGALDILKDHVPVCVAAYPDGISDPDDLTDEQIRSMILCDN